MNDSDPSPSADAIGAAAKPSPESAEELLEALYPKFPLPREQVVAIEMLMAGNPPAAAARAAGVHRATLYRWMKDDPQFGRALRECRAAVRHAAEEHLLGMVDDCMDVVHMAIHGGNAAVALRLLKLMGVFNFKSEVAPTKTAVAAEAVRQE